MSFRCVCALKVCIVRFVVCLRRFKTSKNDHIIEVQLYDDIDFVCPYYPAESSASASASEYYTIYMVSNSCACYADFSCILMIDFIGDRLIVTVDLITVKLKDVLQSRKW